MRALNITKGENLFVAGASGAIGTFIVQMAIAQGAIVSASTSTKKTSLS